MENDDATLATRCCEACVSEAVGFIMKRTEFGDVAALTIAIPTS
jgi:hypothetical protein